MDFTDRCIETVRGICALRNVSDEELREIIDNAFIDLAGDPPEDFEQAIVIEVFGRARALSEKKIVDGSSDAFGN